MKSTWAVLTPQNGSLTNSGQAWGFRQFSLGRGRDRPHASGNFAGLLLKNHQNIRPNASLVTSHHPMLWQSPESGCGRAEGKWHVDAKRCRVSLPPIIGPRSSMSIVLSSFRHFYDAVDAPQQILCKQEIGSKRAIQCVLLLDTPHCLSAALPTAHAPSSLLTHF